MKLLLRRNSIKVLFLLEWSFVVKMFGVNVEFMRGVKILV